MRSDGRAFWVVFAALLLNVAAMGMMIPVLPGIIAGFTGGDFGRAAQLGGIMVAITAELGFVCALVIGSFSDRYGRKPALVVGMIGPGVTYLAMAFATKVAWLFVGVVISGMLGAAQSSSR